MTLHSKEKLFKTLLLVFGLKSDKVRKDTISKGNSLTFQQVFDLAKTEESTRAQMQIITQGDQGASVHFERSKTKSAAPQVSKQSSWFRKSQLNNHSQYPGLTASQRLNSSKAVVLYVENNIAWMPYAWPYMRNANIAAKQGTSKKCA